MPLAKVPPGLAHGSASSRSTPWAWVRHVAVVQWGRTYAEALRSVCCRAFPKADIQAHGTGAEVLAALRAKPVDLLLQTLMFPDMDGVDLLRIVMQEKLAVRVLVASRRRDEQCLYALRNARFDGIVDTLDASVETLMEALHLVAAGHAYVSPSFRDILIDRIVPSDLWHQFTPAEIRIFTVIGDGSDDHEAALILGLSAATVQTHRRNIMHKLGVTSSAKLVREAIRLGMVQITAEGHTIRPGVSREPLLGEPAPAKFTARTG